MGVGVGVGEGVGVGPSALTVTSEAVELTIMGEDALSVI